MNTSAEKLQIARINRKLAKHNEELCTSRSYGEKSDLGRFYVLHTRTKRVVAWRITDLDELERVLLAA